MSIKCLLFSKFQQNDIANVNRHSFIKNRYINIILSIIKSIITKIFIFTYSQMSAQVMPISIKLTLKNSFTPEQLQTFSNLYFDSTDNNIVISLFEWYDKDTFERELTNLLSYVKTNKNKCSGEILVNIRENETITQGQYKVRSKFEFSPCDLVISLRKPKQQTKGLSEEEKIKIFKKYWDAKHSVPAKNEVYEGFRIGQFYSSLLKNDAAFKVLNEIMQND